MDEERNPTLEELSFDEVNAILLHKWFLSEKVGYDIGMEFAKNDFFKYHSKQWRARKLKEDLEHQKDEIVKHKWFLSERLGYDVGFTESALDWISKGYAQQWRDRKGPYKDRK